MLTKKRLSWIWVAVLALVVSGCSSASLGTPGTPDHQYRVALSMSYSGNDWQGEAANLIKPAARKTRRSPSSSSTSPEPRRRTRFPSCNR